MSSKGRATAIKDAVTTKAKPDAHSADSASDDVDAAVSGELQQLLMLKELVRRRLEGYGAAN